MRLELSKNSKPTARYYCTMSLKPSEHGNLHGLKVYVPLSIWLFSRNRIVFSVFFGSERGASRRVNCYKSLLIGVFFIELVFGTTCTIFLEFSENWYYVRGLNLTKFEDVKSYKHKQYQIENWYN